MSEWDCEAYGPEGTKIDALCFVAGDLGERVCASAAECAEQMAAERVRIHGRIHELAATGDDVWVRLAGEFLSPEQLLGGDDRAEAVITVGDAARAAQDRAAEVEPAGRRVHPSHDSRWGDAPDGLGEQSFCGKCQETLVAPGKGITDAAVAECRA